MSNFVSLYYPKTLQREAAHLEVFPYYGRNSPGYLYYYKTNEKYKNGVKLGRSSNILSRLSDSNLSRFADMNLPLAIAGPFVNAGQAEDEFISIVKSKFNLLTSLPGIENPKEFFDTDLSAIIPCIFEVQSSRIQIETKKEIIDEKIDEMFDLKWMYELFDSIILACTKDEPEYIMKIPISYFLNFEPIDKFSVNDVKIFLTAYCKKWPRSDYVKVILEYNLITVKTDINRELKCLL